MTPAFVAPIVEGHGELEAVPALLHRIALDSGLPAQLLVNPPIRIKSGSLLNDKPYFHKYVSLAAAKAAARAGTVLLLLDCEDDCPRELGPRLLSAAQSVRPDVSYLVALAYREYESWFLAAATSLRDEWGLPENLHPPGNVEAIRNAKGWLGSRMRESYDPGRHQLAFTRLFDIQQARTSPSFDRLYLRVLQLLSGAPMIGPTSGGEEIQVP